MNAELIDVEFRQEAKELVLYDARTYGFIMYISVPSEMVNQFVELFQNENKTVSPSGKQLLLCKNVVRITVNRTEWNLFMFNVCILCKRADPYTQPEVYAIKRGEHAIFS